MSNKKIQEAMKKRLNKKEPKKELTNDQEVKVEVKKLRAEVKKMRRELNDIKKAMVQNKNI